MAVTLKEFIQSEFTRANISLFDKDGDYYEATYLQPDPTHRKLQLTPAWSNEILLPAERHETSAALYFEDSAPHYIIIMHYEWSWTTYLLVSYNLQNFTSYTPGISSPVQGKAGRNALYHAGKIYLITYAGVYTCTVTGAATLTYSGNDASLIAAINGNLYLALTTGAVLILNPTSGQFETYFTPALALEVEYLAPFKGYVLYIANDHAGRTNFYRLSASGLTQIATCQGSGIYPLRGCAFAIHNDKLYFSPGMHVGVNGQSLGNVPVHVFDGSTITHIADVKTSGMISSGTLGLTVWQNHLILYALTTGTLATQHIYRLTQNQQFTSFIPTASKADPTVAFYPHLYTLGETLVLLTSGNSVVDDNPL